VLFLLHGLILLFHFIITDEICLAKWERGQQPHERLVSSETWLTCRRKLMKNKGFGGGTTKKAKNTWLAGKVKCGVCGSGLMHAPAPNSVGYFRCRKRADSKSCTGAGKIRVHDVENFIYTQTTCKKYQSML